MEPDRYQKNAKLFILGLASLLLSMSLLGFSLFIMPHLLWGWIYKVPGFIIAWREWLKEYYDYTDAGASWLIFSFFIIPAILFGILSSSLSNYIENQIYNIHPEETEDYVETRRGVQDTIRFSIKIFLLILLVIALVILVEWIIAPPIF